MNKTMRNLTIFGAISALVSGMAATAHLAEKVQYKTAKKDAATATLISRRGVNLEDADGIDGIVLDLDLDNNPKTAEASVIVYDAPVTDSFLKQTIPTGSKRTVWEWKHLGTYCKR